MTKRACIILPTYNEAEMIGELLERVFALDTTPWELSTLVVDDHSPDGTAAIVRRLQPRYPRAYLLEENREGLGKAYIRGFSHVLSHLPHMDYILEMDADGSHNPRYIRAFLTAADQGYDFIIGSRYIPGGACPDWKWHRKMLSYWGNQYIRIVGGLSAVHDCTSGFR